MKDAPKKIFQIAGVYGLLATLPLYFSEGKMGEDYPPPINHPEYYYGFAGVTAAWAILFLFLSKDPVRYRVLMIPSILEKLSFVPPILVLYVQARVPFLFVPLAMIDLLFAFMFGVAYYLTRQPKPTNPPNEPGLREV